jgi:hypothetical protein
MNQRSCASRGRPVPQFPASTIFGVESIVSDDPKSLVLLFDPAARLLFGSIQAKVMTAIGTRLDLSMVQWTATALDENGDLEHEA